MQVKLGCGLVILAVLVVACEQDQMAPTPPSLGRRGALVTAQDSADALEAHSGAGIGIQSHQSSGVVAIHAGDMAVVTVVSASTARCESVGVFGVISQTLFSGVGSCGGVGRSTMIGPAPTDGSLFFALTSSSRSQALVDGQFPDYTVRLDDGLFDADFDDVILSVKIRTPCPPGSSGDAVLDALEASVGLVDALSTSRPDLPPGSRREVGGLVWQRADGTFFTSIVPPGPGTTECRFDGNFAEAGRRPPEPGAVAVAKFHTHPHLHDDPVYGCASAGGTRFAQFPGDRGQVPRARPDQNGGGSPRDWDEGTSDGFPMYVINAAGRVYRLDPGVPSDQRAANPNKWEQTAPTEACFRRPP